MTSNASRHDLATLDRMTGGAFTAATSAERAQRVRDWLASDPAAESMQEIYRELSGRDKGAARLVRERLDELRRQRGQDALAAEWAQRGQALLDQSRMNLADAIAWQRDAAKAGAPLSREPLATLKARLAERARAIEDLQHRAMVQREAAALLAQRIDVLSTHPWQEAQAALQGLQADVQAWRDGADALQLDPSWPSVDARHPTQIESARSQVNGVWQAFTDAVAQAAAAADDASLPLPAVPLWAQEIRQSRAPAAVPAAPAAKVRAPVDPALREAAQGTVQAALSRLESEIAEGHGKASVEAANALRQALREHGRLAGDALQQRAHAALAAAGELESWQRWRADQLREELVAQAEALLKRPAGQELGGRKMQDSLRQLRERWKQLDQSGAPNHGLWRRFDEACTQAHKVVEAWVERLREESAVHRAQRLALIDEINAWAAAQPADPDWRATSRALADFDERWRHAGHLNERQFKDIESAWRAARDAAGAPLEAHRAASVVRRQGLIEEARQLVSSSPLRVDAVRSLQQRWQAEAQTVMLDRRQEQKLWDAFRAPIDEAFARKDAERQRQAEALSQVDRAVLQAASAVQAAVASGDAQQIAAALASLEHAQRAAPAAGAAVPQAEGSAAATPAAGVPVADAESPAAPVPTPRRPVVAVRGDDRPGARVSADRTEPSPRQPGRSGARPQDRSDRPHGRGTAPRADDRGRYSGSPDREAAASRPRLGDAAFRAQRDAVEQAQAALRRLAVQAHGEVVVQLLQAWAQRDAERVPVASALGRGVSAAQRAAWVQAVTKPPQDPADGLQALLRLEMAAEVPTPASHLQDRRALQLHLLTRRHEASPSQTWAQDVARVLSSACDDDLSRRLQAALRVLLGGRSRNA